MNRKTNAPLELSKDEFTKLGYTLVDRIAEHFDTLRQKPLTTGETPAQVREALGMQGLPDTGLAGSEVIERALDATLKHSLFPGHPRFWGYIIGAGTQIGALSDMLAATVNPNVGGWNLAPMATEIELQSISWIAEFIGYPKNAGGILVSGGAMANYVGFLVGRKAKAPWNIREQGLRHATGQLRMYCSKETHTWMQKAADLFGHGTDAIRWIETDDSLRLDMHALEQAIEEDKRSGDIPFLVVANAGSVSTGVVDDLARAAAICQKHDLWYHIDGAYGAPAGGLPELADHFKGMAMADSIALDPHKWFYSPQEAGCVLVRDPARLTDAFSYRPPYYHFEEYEETPGINLYEYGFQNSRGFRALKVWTGFLQAGRNGMQSMIRHDLAMAQLLFELVDKADDFEAFQVNLSIATFRYVPHNTTMDTDQLNTFNERVMVALQTSGEAFITNALIDGKFLLRACIVNFRTREEDINALPGLIRKIGKAVLEN
jgi:glutamate/tyrosine decarboxylase-like PLP-dependent enzyme